MRVDLSLFWSQVDKSGECWLWTGVTNNNGYGSMGKWMAHRLSYTLHCGRIPRGMHVCHRCDVRLCVRPDHLFIGTARDNIHDMIRKRRMPLGERRAFAKLTEDQVREIKQRLAAAPRTGGGRRKNGCAGTTAILAKEFGVAAVTIQRIDRGEKWKHVA